LPTDPIDRSAAKDDDLLKRDDVLMAVHGAIKEVLGVTAIRARVGYAIEAALDKLPALDAPSAAERRPAVERPAMSRDEATVVVHQLIVTIDGYAGVPLAEAEKVLGEARYAAMMADKIRSKGPTTETVYPWNVVDYLTSGDAAQREE
jgi:hypothetical protein